MQRFADILRWGRMARPLVTIVTPTYNHERFIGQCIESALAQSYAHWEQIVVDDGSSDATAQIVASFRDPRIRLLTLPHRGLKALAESYNNALRESSGELVGILEGDDRWPPDKLERQVPMFDARTTLLTWGRADLIDAANRVTGVGDSLRSRDEIRMSTVAAFAKLSRVNIFSPTVTVMVRRTALQAIGGFQQTGSALFVDLPTWLHVTAHCVGEVQRSTQTLGHYRVHPDQTTRQQSSQMRREHGEVVAAVVATLDEGTRQRIGWNGLRPRAQSRSRLAHAEELLSLGAYSAAAGAFARALPRAADVPDALFAALGVLSSGLRCDLINQALRLRRALSRQRANRP